MLNQGATLISRLAVFFAVLFTLAACGGGGGGGATFFDGDDPVPPPVTPAYLVQLTLLDANGAPISSLPQLAEGTLQIVVIENQEAGIPVAGALVNVSTSIGSLVPTNGRALTDANGVANLKVIAGTTADAGTITASTQIDDLTIASELNFEVTEEGGGTVKYFLDLNLLDTDGQPATSVTERTQVTLQIVLTRDSETGPPVVGTIVNATTTLGSLAPANGLTDSNGMVALKFIVGTTLGAGTISASAVINGETISDALNFAVTGRMLKLGYFDAGNTFIENEIQIVPETTLAAGGDAQLSVVILDENNERVTAQEAVTFNSGCIAAAQSTINPIDPVSVNAQASTLYSAVNCSGTDNITASIAGTGAQAFGTLEIAGPETNSINFVSADPTLIVLRGTGGVNRDETSDVVFTVIDQSGRPLPGVTVNFSLSTSVGGLALSKTSALSNGDGQVSVTVQAGDVATVVRVLATIGDGGGNPVTTVSDLIAVTTGLPDQNSISLSVEQAIVPNAFNVDGLTTTLTVRMSDKFNNPVVDGTTAVFTTEYGSIIGACNTSAGACNVDWTSSNPRFPTLSGQTNIRTIKNTGCSAFIGSPRVPCPLDLGFTRGARSTVLVHAIGEESFIDRNGNGIIDEAEKELFSNLSEAFIDHNEDGEYTPDGACVATPNSSQCKAGFEEIFVDFNRNGEFDRNDNPPLYNGLLCPVEGNGVWCSRTLLNVWDDIVVTLSDDTTWTFVMVRGNRVVDQTLTDATQTVYISDQFNNAPPAGSTLTLSVKDNCEIVGETNFTVPVIFNQGAYGIPVITRPRDDDPEPPEVAETGTFAVTLNPADGSSVSETYDCDVTN